MQLPADLSEGWWWVRHDYGRTQVIEIVKRQGGWAARFGSLETAAGLQAEYWTAMERVAPPSWGRDDG